MEIHPFADIFPLMSDDEFQKLVDDIRLNGQHEPIWTYQNKIIDGRNRFNACQALKREPLFREWFGGGSLISFVVSLNLHRRHLNESQRAMVAAKLATMERGHNPSIEGKLSQNQASEMLNVSVASVERAAAVLKNALPEIVEQVEHGEMAVSKAAEIAKLPKGKQKRLLKRGRDKMKKLGAELLQKTVKAVAKKSKSACFLCNPETPLTDAEFRVHLFALRARSPQHKRYIDPILEEMDEMELAEPVREASEKILAAVDLGLQEAAQIITRTRLAKDLFEAATSFLVHYGDLEVVEQGGKSEVARGKRKTLYRRPVQIDPFVKMRCADCDQIVGKTYKKIDFETVICQKCAEEETNTAMGLDE